MAGGGEPVYSLTDFAEKLGMEWSYPFFAVALYTPTNGLDGRLHEYVAGQWHFLNSMTGDSCLLFALEDVDRGPTIESFRPEDVYDIARYLGVSVSDIPALCFFVDPLQRNETLVLKLRDLMGAGDEVDAADLTDFFRSLSAITDVCGHEATDDRLECLRKRAAERWPSRSRWSRRANDAREWIVQSSADSATVLQSVQSAVNLIAGIS